MDKENDKWCAGGGTTKTDEASARGGGCIKRKGIRHRFFKNWTRGRREAKKKKQNGRRGAAGETKPAGSAGAESRIFTEFVMVSKIRRNPKTETPYQ